MNRRPVDTKLSQAILGFQQFKTAEALSPCTLVNYDCALRLWLSHVGDVDLIEITTSSVLEYLAWLRVEYKPRRLSGREGPLSSKTIRNAYAIFSAFFKWACAEFNLPNLMEKVPTPRFQRPSIEPFKKEEIEAMLKAVNSAKKPTRTSAGNSPCVELQRKGIERSF